MNRRDTLKVLGLTAVGSTLLVHGCGIDNKSKLIGKENLETQPGREAFEVERINRLNSEKFFDDHEMATLAVLADIIIPRDEVSGSATEAGVPDFIEFIVKDIPEHKIPMRGGLKWLDVHCLNRFGIPFKDCSGDQQIEVVDDIAYPDKVKPGMEAGVAFFNRMRNLTASGFYTTKMGIDDIGYVGNTPGVWKGVPADVLAQYNLTDNS